MNRKLSRYIEAAALAVGFIFFFGIMISAELREGMGAATDVGLGWMPGILPFQIVLLVLAAITGLFATLIQKYTMDWEFMRSAQTKARRLQMDMREVQLSGDKARQQRLQEEQLKMVSEQGKMMQMQFKPMLFIGIVSIPLFMWAYFYIGNHNITMVFPFWGPQSITSSVFGPIIYWFYWYFICSIPLSQIIRKALDVGSMS